METFTENKRERADLKGNKATAGEQGPKEHQVLEMKQAKLQRRRRLTGSMPLRINTENIMVRTITAK